MMQDPRVAGNRFGSFPSNFFMQPFQYFQIVNLVDCLSSWYKFITNNPSNISSRTLLSDNVCGRSGGILPFTHNMCDEQNCYTVCWSSVLVYLMYSWYYN